MERMEQERERLSAHIEELVRTRDALDVLMATNRAHRKTLRRATRRPDGSGVHLLQAFIIEVPSIRAAGLGTRPVLTARREHGVRPPGPCRSPPSITSPLMTKYRSSVGR
ncbi:hypothetical protein SMICM304S_09716 [Streptomyces microflavus]